MTMQDRADNLIVCCQACSLILAHLLWLPWYSYARPLFVPIMCISHSQSWSVTVGSAEPSMDKASLLAKTVYEGVRQRVQQLQADVQARDQQVAALQADLEAAASQRDVALKQAQCEQQVRDFTLSYDAFTVTAHGTLIMSPQQQICNRSYIQTLLCKNTVRFARQSLLESVHSVLQ